MRTIQLLTILSTLFLYGANVTAQTADEIIAKYLQATGGKELISKINTMYMEGKMMIMGNEGSLKSTIINGKGSKQEMQIIGSTIVTCITDNGGWTINPMTGATGAEVMPEAQYKSSKDEIFIGAPFLFYAEKGYKAELAGTETVGNMNATKVKLTSPDNAVTIYFFDPETGYIIKSLQQGEMGDNVITYSDYQKSEGYASPFKMEMNMGGGQIQMSMTITKLELNKPVDAAIFVKP